MQCRNQDDRLRERCDQALLNVERTLEEIQANEEAARQDALRQEADWKRQCEAEQVKEKKERRDNFVSNHIMLLILAPLLIVSLVIGGIAEIRAQMQLETVDAFADIEIRYSGVSSDGRVEILNNSTNPFLQTVTYTASPASGLSNGDTFTVQVEYNKSLARGNGYRINSTLKQYTVTGLNSYVTDISEIDAVALSNMEQQAEDIIQSTLAEYSAYTLALHLDLDGANLMFFGDQSLTCQEYVLRNSYFLTLKPEYAAELNNRYIIVYEVPVIITGYDFYYDGSIFWAVRFDNLMVDYDGETVVTLAAGKCTSMTVHADEVYESEIGTQKQYFTVTEVPIEFNR